MLFIEPLFTPFILPHKQKKQADPKTGALNLQGIEFVRKGGGNCKEMKIR